MLQMVCAQHMHALVVDLSREGGEERQVTLAHRDRSSGHTTYMCEQCRQQKQQTQTSSEVRQMHVQYCSDNTLGCSYHGPHNSPWSHDCHMTTWCTSPCNVSSGDAQRPWGSPWRAGVQYSSIHYFSFILCYCDVSVLFTVWVHMHTPPLPCPSSSTPPLPLHHPHLPHLVHTFPLAPPPPTPSGIRSTQHEESSGHALPCWVHS